MNKTIKKTTDRDLQQIVKKAPSNIHGNGLFALLDFEKDQYIGTYAGIQTTENDTYVLWVYDDNDEANALAVDGKNLLRYLNHSKKPNTVFYDFDLYANRAIKQGEELCFDYGETPD